MSDDDPLRQDLGAAVVRGVRWTAISRPVIEVVLMASMVVVARLVPPAEFGRVAVALALSELAISVPTEGVGTALVQRASLTRAHLQAGVALALLSSAALCVVTLVLASVVIDPVFGAHTAHLVRLITPGFLLYGAAAVPMARLRRRLAFRTLTVIDMVTTSIRAGGSVALALAGLDGEALIFATLVAATAAVTMAWACAPAPFPRLRRQPAAEILDYGLPAAVASISWVGFRNCDYALIGARLGATQAGLYFRAYTLAVEYQRKVSLVMGSVGFPVLARAGGEREIAVLTERMVRLLSVLLFPCLVLLAIVAPVLVPWVFGPAWSGAVGATQILAVGGAATLLIDAVGAALMAAGRARALLGYGWAHFVVYASAVLLVAPMGLEAVAVAAAVVHAAFLVVAYELMLRGGATAGRPIRRLAADVRPAIGACVGLAAVALPLQWALSSWPPLPHLLVVGLVGAVAYVATLRLCFPETYRSVAAFARQVLPHRPMGRSTGPPVPAGAHTAG